MQEIIDRKAEIAALGLTVDSVFVPFSRSRNKDEKAKTLNWRVTVKRNGREVLTTDYSAGIAHAPSYGKKAWQKDDSEIECETGWTHKAPGGIGSKLPIMPNPLDVLYSLHMDSDVLNYPTFENWAADFGYDPDSRKGEGIYRACLETALKMRAALGDKDLQRLSEIFQDY